LGFFQSKGKENFAKGKGATINKTQERLKKERWGMMSFCRIQRKQQNN